MLSRQHHRRVAAAEAAGSELGPGVTNVGYLVVLTNGITTASGTLPSLTRITQTSKLRCPPARRSRTLRSTGSASSLARSSSSRVRRSRQSRKRCVVVQLLHAEHAGHDERVGEPLHHNRSRDHGCEHWSDDDGAHTAKLANAAAGPRESLQGTLQIPYYSSRPTQANPTAPLTATWLGGPSALDATSKLLTRFNPVPIATETISIPVFVTVPNAASPSHGCEAHRWLACAHLPARPHAQQARCGRRRRLVCGPGLRPSSPSTCLCTASVVPPRRQTRSTTLRTSARSISTSSTTTRSPADRMGRSIVRHAFRECAESCPSRETIFARARLICSPSRARWAPSISTPTPQATSTRPRIYFLGPFSGRHRGRCVSRHRRRAEVVTGELANAGGGVAQTIFDSPAFGPRIKAGLAAQGITERLHALRAVHS